MSALGLADWTLWGLVFARLAPSGVALGLLAGGGTLPLWLGLALSLSLAPALAHGLDGGALLAAGPPVLLLALLRELCLGAAFATAAALPWLTLSYTLRTLSASELLGSEVLSRLYTGAALALCLALGAPRAYLRALAESLVSAPLVGPAPARGVWLHELMAGAGAALESTLALALPLWASLWLLDVTLALVARAIGHTEPLARSPLRGALGLLLLGLCLAPISAYAPAWLRGALREAGELVVRLAR